jgi:ribosomal protein S18 acetylase RimI-like enzyme
MSCCVEAFIPPAIEPLLLERLLKPWRPHASLAPESAWRERARARAYRILSGPGAHPIRRASGFACWTFLPWDTEQFGFPAARLDFLLGDDLATLLELVLDSARDGGVRHLVARVPAWDLSGVHALARSGFEYLDGLQTFSLRPAPDPGYTSSIVRKYRRSDLSSILQIARTSYSCDRFHADAALPRGTADRVNEAWVRNCCSGGAADIVLVAEDEEQVLGFAASQVDSNASSDLGLPLGTIVLVATSQQARRRGIARDLTRASLAWFAERGAAMVEVGTQLTNVPAARLYESCGFRQAGCTLTFRKLL